MNQKRKCEQCKKSFIYKICISNMQSGFGKFCYSKCYGFFQRNKPKLYRIGEKYGYWAVHNWLKYNFGKADKCEMESCKKISKNFEWAKKIGKEYIKDRNNFLKLCRSCHRKYDYTVEKRKIISDFMKTRKISKNTRKKMSISQRLRWS